MPGRMGSPPGRALERPLALYMSVRALRWSTSVASLWRPQETDHER